MTTNPPTQDDPLADAGRLSALAATRLLDAPADPALDRYTRLARTLFRTGAALLTLVDEDRVVVKSGALRPGTDCPPELWTLPVAQAPCAWVVRHGRPLVVMDLQADARFAGYDAPGLPVAGAYAGVPLHVDGRVLGTLCLIDPMPRVWSEADVAPLADVAEAAAAELAQRDMGRRLQSASSAFKTATQALGLAMQTVGLATFEWHLDGDEVSWCTSLTNFLGVASDRRWTFERFLDRVQPADRERVRRALLQARDTGGGCCCEFGLLQPDGSERRIELSGRVMGDGELAPRRLFAVAVDVCRRHGADATG